MKTTQPKDWQKQVREWYRGYSEEEKLLVLNTQDRMINFITDLLKDAVEAERARIESLIPEKKGMPIIGFDSDYQYGERNGFNEAVSIMQEAVKN